MIIVLDQRFWSKVNKQGPQRPGVRGRCWEWQAAKTKRGYGRYRHPVTALPHRLSYMALHGPVEGPLDHLCNSAGCVRPSHLEPVTVAENNKRCSLRGSFWTKKERALARTHCGFGHEYTEENTYWYRGIKHCRQCRRRNRFDFEARRVS